LVDFWCCPVAPAILVRMSDVTRISSQIEQGDPQAAEKLLPLVYNELRKLAAGSAGGAVTVFNVAPQKQLLTLQGHLGRINSVVFSPDGKCLASASEDGKVILWDVIRGEQKTVLEGPAGRPCLAFSPDGKTLASGG
jgi:WD40 repeat protein